MNFLLILLAIALTEYGANSKEPATLVTAVAVGEPPMCGGARSEHPVRRRVEIEPRNEPFVIIISGIAYRTDKKKSYADAVTVWEGFKLDQETMPLRNPKGPVRLQCLDDKGVIVETVVLSQDISSDHYYSFKQGRNLAVVTPDSAVSVLDLDVSNLSEYRGCFRVQLFARDDNGHIHTTFEPSKADRFPRGKEFKLGPPLSFKGENSQFAGEFLLPVSDVEMQWLNASTSRKLSGLPKNKNVTLDVSGLYIFSSTYPSVPRHHGGGGGYQDVANRYDHFASGTKTSPYLPEKWKFQAYSADGTKLRMNVADGVDAHEYVINLNTPLDGTIYFYMNDASPFMTQDNAGAFVVQARAKQ